MNMHTQVKKIMAQVYSERNMSVRSSIPLVTMSLLVHSLSSFPAQISVSAAIRKDCSEENAKFSSPGDDSFSTRLYFNSDMP